MGPPGTKHSLSNLLYVASGVDSVDLLLVIAQLGQNLSGVTAQLAGDAVGQVGGVNGLEVDGAVNEDGLGAIVNSSRGIIAAYKQEAYAKFGETGYADAARQAVLDMKADINSAIK